MSAGDDQTPQDEGTKRHTWTMIGAGVGAFFGQVIPAATDNLEFAFLALGFGIALGVAIGAIIDRERPD